jgi:hypothetical protein
MAELSEPNSLPRLSPLAYLDSRCARDLPDSPNDCTKDLQFASDFVIIDIMIDSRYFSHACRPYRKSGKKRGVTSEKWGTVPSDFATYREMLPSGRNMAIVPSYENPGIGSDAPFSVNTPT